MASSRLSDEDVDRIELLITEVIEEKLKVPRIVNNSGEMTKERNGHESSFRRLVDGVLIVGIASLVGVVWNQSITVSSLATQVQNLTQEVQLLRASK